MVDSVFSQIIPLTAAMALPFPVIKGTRLLLVGKPVTHSLLFIVTWGVTFFMALLTSILFKESLLNFLGALGRYTPPESFSGWMHIVLGFLFMGIGVKRLKLGLERKNTPAAPQYVELSASAIIKSTVKIELFSLKNGLLLFFIIYILLKSQMSFGHTLVATGLISLTSMIWVSMPLLVYFWTGSKRGAVLEALKEWLIANNATLIVFIYLFIGISTLSTGIGEMIPKLLETVFITIPF